MPFVEQKKLIKNKYFCLSLVRFNESLFDDSVDLPPHILSSVRKRKSEYYAGRLAAGDALSFFNLDKHVGTAKDRSPIWPDGSRGSITHDDSAAAAVVSTSLNIGLDVEDVLTDKVATDIVDMVASRDEVDILPFSKNESVSIVFSSKESIFKCLYPDVKKFFDFKDAELVKVNPLNKNFVELSFNIKSNLSNYIKKGTEVKVWCLISSGSVITIGVKKSDSSDDFKKDVISSLLEVNYFLE